MENNEVVTYRFRLDPGSKKFRCPNCNKKRFVRYIDQQTDEYLPDKYGRCDRENNCGYFKDPYRDGYVNEKDSYKLRVRCTKAKQDTIDYIPYTVFSASLRAYQENMFVQYLVSLFDRETAEELINTYRIGTSRHWGGSTVFWQIDIQRNIRTGKVMLYGSDGHRVKQPYNYINWVHSLLYESYNLQQCLFGEHLLTGDKRIPVAIVESEKTAIISSVYFPEFIWLAAGAKSNLKPERCKCLMGRSVTLFPDLGAYDDWKQKAGELSYFCDITVSDVLESSAASSDKKKGYDLADYLTQHDVDSFIKNEEPIDT